MSIISQNIPKSCFMPCPENIVKSGLCSCHNNTIDLPKVNIPPMTLTQETIDLIGNLPELKGLNTQDGALCYSVIVAALNNHAILSSLKGGEQRFLKPTDQQIVNTAIVFNDGNIDMKELQNMVAMADFIINRLYENGDITIPASNEEK